MIKIKKLPFWATSLTILGVIVLCGLGTWQLQRLAWKTDLLTKIETAKTRAQNLKRESDFRPLTYGKIFGHYLHDHEVPIGPRTHKGKPGYHILTPFVLPGNGTILVNRGWVPLDLKKAKTRPKSLVLGYIDVKGLVRTPEKQGIFTPHNKPAKEAWYHIDIDQIRAERDLSNLIPALFYAEEETNPSGSAYPINEATIYRPNNNHFAYALFWFAMAGTLVVVYVLRFVAKPKP